MQITADQRERFAVALSWDDAALADDILTEIVGSDPEPDAIYLALDALITAVSESIR